MFVTGPGGGADEQAPIASERKKSVCFMFKHLVYTALWGSCYAQGVSFVTALALGIALLVAAPLLAHRLRRLRADERPFAPTKLVSPAQPRARRRAKLEDRALFGVRAAAVVALALLGASPLVTCSRLSLSRSSGASMAVAIIVDDSMSMRARVSPTKTRFARAKEAAAEVVAGAREGDAVAVILAGAPARVALAPTTELDAVSAVVSSLKESDRATDLDGAIRIAETLLATLPQVDKRVVLLSDLADGQPDAPPVGEASSLPVWTPLAEIASDASDCGIISADDVGGRVHVRLACGKDASAVGRTVEVRAGTRVLGSAKCGGPDVNVDVAKEEQGERTAYLLGGDAIASDDSAPVLVQTTGAIGVVAEAVDETAVTGGPPVLEQALDALHTELATRPLPAVPDQATDFAGLIGLVADDPPGFTPEQRRALASYLDGGGVVLVALGGRAASAPLGATLDPLLAHATTWTTTGAKVKGVAPDAPTDFLGESTRSITELDAAKRTTLAPADVASLDVLVKWSDGAPLVAKKNVGRGDVYVTTLPFALDASDLPVRPAFIALLDAFVASARTHASLRRADVGSTWTLPSGTTITEPVDFVREAGRVKLTPPVIGAYHLKIDGHDELRVAAPVARETDLRPRKAHASERASKLGATQARVDVSSYVAVLLLALLFAEMVLRARARPRPTRDARAA